MSDCEIGTLGAEDGEHRIMAAKRSPEGVLIEQVSLADVDVAVNSCSGSVDRTKAVTENLGRDNAGAKVPGKVLLESLPLTITC